MYTLHRGLFVVTIIATFVAAAASPSHAATRPLNTAFYDPWAFAPNSSVPFDALTHARDRGGANFVRLPLSWRQVAPSEPEAPANPDNQKYDWDLFDAQVEAALAAGLTPIVFIHRAPNWAENNGKGGPNPAGVAEGSWKPDPAALEKFAQAAAAHDESERPWGGVRYWQVWNEPNLNAHLYPQKKDGKLFAPVRYRKMVNAVATGVHTLDETDDVVAGGLAPYGQYRKGRTAPMTFMRKMLCMSKRPYSPVCPATSQFEIWSHHPYSCGGPNRHAYSSNDIAVADLPEMRRLLNAAIRYDRVVRERAVRFWVTELGWITKPPRTDGVPLKLHARWTAEALYRSWKAGVTLVTWFPLVDRPRSTGPWQSGLYTRYGEPKTASLRAFRFPFVAYVRSGRVFTWGRTSPNLRNRYVTIERRTSSGGWRAVGRVWAGRTGVFKKTFSISTSGSLRARVGDAPSTKFSLNRPNDPYICAFTN